MRNIKVSESVWQEIAKRGKFGETEDDVLRREFSLPPEPEEPAVSGSGNGPVNGVDGGRAPRPRQRYATRRISSGIRNGHLYVEIDGGPHRSWKLPSRSDKIALKQTRDEAVLFAEEQGATLGQRNAVIKSLTANGYHLTK
jgi:hypothetical protein